jgi:hypothetical protein
MKTSSKVLGKKKNKFKKSLLNSLQILLPFGAEFDANERRSTAHLAEKRKFVGDAGKQSDNAERGIEGIRARKFRRERSSTVVLTIVLRLNFI